MTDCLGSVCAEGTMGVLFLFCFVQNVIGVEKIVNNLVLECLKFDFFTHKKG